MLGKLIKYNSKSISRIILPLYLVIAATTLMTSIVYIIPFDNTFMKVFQGMTCFVYILSLLALIFGTVISVLIHFYQNSICDQAYFTYSIPANMSLHIIAKTIVGSIWTFLTILASFLSILLVLFANDAKNIRHEIQEIQSEVTKLCTDYLHIPVLVAVLLFILFVIGMLFMQMMIYQLCFAAGQTFQEHKLIGSILAYIIIYTVMQVVLAIPMLICFLIFGFEMSSLSAGYSILISDLIVGIIATIVSFYLTKYYLTKKLNLD